MYLKDLENCTVGVIFWASGGEVFGDLELSAEHFRGAASRCAISLGLCVSSVYRDFSTKV